MPHNIVAVFPDFGTLKLHDLCLKSGTKTIVVTVLDTCGDSDCSGCCTENKAAPMSSSTSRASPTLVGRGGWARFSGRISGPPRARVVSESRCVLSC